MDELDWNPKDIISVALFVENQNVPQLCDCELRYKFIRDWDEHAPFILEQLWQHYLLCGHHEKVWWISVMWARPGAHRFENFVIWENY